MRTNFDVIRLGLLSPAKEEQSKRDEFGALASLAKATFFSIGFFACMAAARRSIPSLAGLAVMFICHEVYTVAGNVERVVGDTPSRMLAATGPTLFSGQILLNTMAKPIFGSSLEKFLNNERFF